MLSPNIWVLSQLPALLPFSLQAGPDCLLTSYLAPSLSSLLQLLLSIVSSHPPLGGACSVPQLPGLLSSSSGPGPESYS